MVLGKNLVTVLVIGIGAMFILGGCNNISKAGSENKPTPAVEQGKVADAVKELEKEGKYPVLDRSDTLLGVDNNKNGIRDDIEKYIDTMKDTTDDQKSALKQVAHTYNYILSSDVDVTKEETATGYSEMSDVARNCLNLYYDNESQSWGMQRTIQAYTFNTKKRLEIYLKLDDTADGMTFKLNTKGGCDESFFKK